MKILAQYSYQKNGKFQEQLFIMLSKILNQNNERKLKEKYRGQIAWNNNYQLLDSIKEFRQNTSEKFTINDVIKEVKRLHGVLLSRNQTSHILK